MDTDKILRSTLTEETRTQKGDTKTCLLCGLSYFLTPIRCRENLGLTDSSKQVQQCKTYPEHLERSSQVVKELKERDTHAKQEGREVTTIQDCQNQRRGGHAMGQSCGVGWSSYELF